MKFYKSGLGAPGGSETWLWEVGGTITGITGSGKSSSIPVYTLNSYTTSAFGNSYENSLYYGQTWYYNSAIGDDMVNGFVGLRYGDFYFHTANDVGFFKGWKPSDWGHTASATLGYSFGDGRAEFSTDMFTGSYLFNEDGSPQIENGTYNQGSYQESLNQAHTSFRLSQGGSLLSLGMMGPAWGQNWVHDGGLPFDIGNAPRFNYPYETEFFSRLRQLFLILLGSFLAVCVSCAPQKIRRDASGVYLLPEPKFSTVPDHLSSPVAGKKYLGKPNETSSGQIVGIFHFFHDGKYVSQTASYPGLQPLNDVDHFGFYTATQTEVQTATYAYDSRIPGYRYYYGKSLIDPEGNLVFEDGVVLMPIGEATEPA